MAYEIRQYKEADGREGPAFSAGIWRKGSNVGTVWNDGNGSSNRYDFRSPEEEKAFTAAAKVFAPLKTFEPEDAFIEELIVRRERQRYATRVAKKGSPIAVEVVVETNRFLPGVPEKVRYIAGIEEKDLRAWLATHKHVSAARILSDGSLGPAL